MQKKGIKINLALIDDATEGLNLVKRAYGDIAWNQLEKLPSYIEQVLVDAENALGLANQGQSKAIFSARKIAEMAKELGVPNPKIVEEIFKNTDMEELNTSYNKSIDSINSMVKKYS